MATWELIATTCTDGDCPKMWRDRETGTVRLRGADPDNPTVERNIEMSAADFGTLLGQLPR